jgi:hypothetical protein
VPDLDHAARLPGSFVERQRVEVGERAARASVVSVVRDVGDEACGCGLEEHTYLCAFRQRGVCQHVLDHAIKG